MIEAPVLISGAGPVGLTLALALSSKGVRSLVVERNAALPADLAPALSPFPLSSALSDPGIDCRPGWALFGFERFADYVTAHITEVGGERQQQVRAQFLVGCDGAHSRVRNFLDIDLQPIPTACGEGASAVHSHLARSFGRGRVILAGDAAHPMPQGDPKGLGLGIGDALSLADKLASVLCGRVRDMDVVASYELERRDLAVLS